MARRAKAEKRWLISATLKPIQDALSELEERISELEDRKNELEKTLAEPEIIRDKGKYLPLLNQYNEVKQELKALILEWEHKQDEFVSAKRDLEM